MRTIRVKKGDVIFSEGNVSDAFYIILDGRFEVTKLDENARKRLIGTLGPNQFFGEMGVLTGDSRTATVTALGPGELKVLNPKEFDSLLDKKPEFLRPILRVMAKRLSDSQPQ